MGLRAEAPMFSFNCCSLGRDDKVWWGSVGFYATFHSMTKEAVCLVPWTQRSPELLRTLRSHRFHAWLWGISGLFPGRWDMKRVPQPPAGLGQGLRAMGIVALRTANTSLHGILPGQSIRPKWKTRLTPVVTLYHYLSDTPGVLLKYWM